MYASISFFYCFVSLFFLIDYTEIGHFIPIHYFICMMQLLLMPILEGKAIAYSFVSTPDVRIGVAFGSGGSQSLPATELPGVSSWLV